ncbi:PREDICTED: phytosulfokine receptor 1-like [Tarenaya hassleriana]|uniref:phytosulfokine receptor 1-like n=1 Tax=Tarenaya hassleriana TaxID=28532 RepID=UPI00053C3D3F|nr:PREDICTED: phytosulfokine receptor 1-like [Tarenaya hassleriana]
MKQKNTIPFPFVGCNPRNPTLKKNYSEPYEQRCIITVHFLRQRLNEITAVNPTTRVNSNIDFLPNQSVDSYYLRLHSHHHHRLPLPPLRIFFPISLHRFQWRLLSLSFSLFYTDHSLHTSPMDATLQAVLAAVASFCFVMLILSFTFLVCRRRRPAYADRRRNRTARTSPDPSPNPGGDLTSSASSIDESACFDPSISHISMSELSAATKGFSSDLIVGDGSFGLVYRAELSNGVVVAVKKLDPDAIQGFREFRAEMETLGRLHHPNIVRILGYCISGQDRVLIYEFLERGSLDFWLHDENAAVSSPLSWPTRVNIARGIANGLAYLHGLSKPIIHRDIKSSNILLGPNFEAHISDFGLARRIDFSRSHVSTQVAGTMGYMPPEYWEGNTAATVKADVYSFGVLMVEIATRRRPNWPVMMAEEDGGRGVGLVEWATEMYGQKRYSGMVEGGIESVESVKEYYRIACLCLNEVSRERPAMKEVAEMLERVVV